MNEDDKMKKDRAAELKLLQDKVRNYAPHGVSLVDELLEDRSLEVAKEWQERHGYGSIEYWLEIVRKQRRMATRE